MANYPEHTCPSVDDDGQPAVAKVATCGICSRSWCERCDPAPSALCPWCHGIGHSTAPVPPRQVERIKRIRQRATPALPIYDALMRGLT